MMTELELRTISPETFGDIRRNEILVEHILNNDFTNRILKTALKGTPLIKIGSGHPRLMLTAGVHGNELPPQIAALRMAENLKSQDISGTVFIIPFAIPQATMHGSRRFKGFDMNRKASSEGYITNKIIENIKFLKISAVADFHATKPNSNPGVESIFCSKKPCVESFKIAEHINEITSSKVICHEIAGSLYNGALEDECNLTGVPAVTCEVVSYNNKIDSGSFERSYLQMMAYLDYFDVIQNK